MHVRESTEDAATTVSLKNSCHFLTIFKQGKDKHKYITDLENCLSSVKIADFRDYDFCSLKVPHSLLGDLFTVEQSFPVLLVLLICPYGSLF